MKVKPWPLIFLAILQILTPILALTLNAGQYEMSAAANIEYMVLLNGWFPVLSYFFLYFGLGFLIFWMKAWSYALMFIILILSWALNYSAWSLFPEAFSGQALLLTSYLDIFLIFYFALPAVRLTYLHARVRWWESAPRYKVDSPAEIKTNVGNFTGEVVDISDGGCFLSSKNETFVPGQEVMISFNVNGPQIIPGKVIYQRGQGFGIQWVFADKVQQKRVKTLVKAVGKNGDSVREVGDRWLDLARWLKRALTGKGLVPEFDRGLIVKK